MSFKKLIYGSIPLLIVILGITYLTSGFNAFPNALVAWGTLMLAIATFMLIRHSEKQEQRRREYEQQNRDEDKERDFRRRLIDDIFRWAHEATVSVNAIGGVKSQKDLRNILPSLGAALAYFRDAGLVIDTSKGFFSEAFTKLVFETLDNFKAYVGLLKPTKTKLSTKQKEGINTARSAIDQSLIHLKDAIIRLRVDLKL